MSTTYRVLSDQLYRSVATVTTSNVVTEAYDTDAYGNTLCYSEPGTDGLWFTDDDVQTNNPINTTIFTGRQYDPESLLYWYRARFYSPQMGRFISRDPLKNAELRQSPDLYLYVWNAPINRVDPSGLSSWIQDKSYPALLSGRWKAGSPVPIDPVSENGHAVYYEIRVTYTAQVVVRCICKKTRFVRPAIGTKQVTLTVSVFDPNTGGVPAVTYDPASTASDVSSDLQGSLVKGVAEGIGNMAGQGATDAYHNSVNIGQWNPSEQDVLTLAQNEAPTDPNFGDWVSGNPCNNI